MGRHWRRTSPRLFSRVIAMLLMTGVIYLFWITPPSSPKLATALFIAMGFLLYIPQMLIAAMAMTLGTKRASAAAVGLTGIFGYASTILSGWGLGLLVKTYGWDRGFLAMFVIAILGVLTFALAWPAKAHGYAEDNAPRQ